MNTLAFIIKTSKFSVNPIIFSGNRGGWRATPNYKIFHMLKVKISNCWVLEYSLENLLNCPFNAFPYRSSRHDWRQEKTMSVNQLIERSPEANQIHANIVKKWTGTKKVKKTVIKTCRGDFMLEVLKVNLGEKRLVIEKLIHSNKFMENF